MGRRPHDRTLPTYVGIDPKTGYLRYFRRPPVGVNARAFVRSFGTSNKTEMRAKYAAIHAEADRLFTIARTGREKSDNELRALALLCVTTFTIFDDQMDGDTPSLMDRAQIERRLFSTLESNEPIGLVDHEQWSKGQLAIKRIERVQLNEPDRAQLLSIFIDEYHRERLTKTRQVRTNTVQLEQQLREHVTVPPVNESEDSLTMMAAFDQAWKPSKTRPPKSEDETRVFVTQFIEVIGDKPIQEQTRQDWAKWRTYCLDRDGPGSTAFKRFGMVKAVVNEAIRAGLIKRKNFDGNDVILKKPDRSQLRNEGWSDDELKAYFGTRFRNRLWTRHGDALYWVSVICMYTGARREEVAGMKVADLEKRHGVWTFFFARQHGKTEESRRIVPIPQPVIDLRLFDYVRTVDPAGMLFPTLPYSKKNGWGDAVGKASAKLRKKVGLVRKGCDLHAFRHHVKTMLIDQGAPDSVNDWITGHVTLSVARGYGRIQFETAAKYLDKIKYPVRIPKWTTGKVA